MTHWKKHWSNTTAIPSVETLRRNERPEDGREASVADRFAEKTTPRKKPEHDYLTTSEAGYVVRLSPRTLERMRLDGTGPPFIKAGPGRRARVFYNRQDLQAWLDSFKFTSTSEYGR